MADFAAARQHMVDCQIRTNKVFDQALVAALAEMPREAFVPEAMRALAYLDEDLPCGSGRCLIEPMVFARLVELLELAPSDIVLDIGCATGYDAAVLSRLASTVVALEPDAALAEAAQANLAALGIDNVVVVEGALAAGYAEQGPYNAIFLGGAVPALDSVLTGQLADGGRLAAVVRPPGGVGRAVQARRLGDTVSERAFFDANVPLLPGFETKPEFVL